MKASATILLFFAMAFFLTAPVDAQRVGQVTTSGGGRTHEAGSQGMRGSHTGMVQVAPAPQTAGTSHQTGGPSGNFVSMQPQPMPTGNFVQMGPQAAGAGHQGGERPRPFGATIFVAAPAPSAGTAAAGAGAVGGQASHNLASKRPSGPLVEMRPVPPVVLRRHHDDRFRRFHHGFGFCDSAFAFGIHTRHVGFFGRQISCFHGIFVSPFFFGPYVVSSGNGYAAVQPGTEVAEAGFLGSDYLPPSTIFLPDPNAPLVEASETVDRDAVASSQPTKPLTLLELKDGYMYGLTDYWLEDGQLYYFTSYGAKNSVPIERVDLDKTVRLNWERGVEFVLRPAPTSH